MVKPSIDPLTRADVKTQLMGFHDNATIRVIPIKFSDGTAGLGITYYPYLDPNSPTFAGARSELTVVEGQDLKTEEFDVILRLCNPEDVYPIDWALDQIEDILCGGPDEQSAYAPGI